MVNPPSMQGGVSWDVHVTRLVSKIRPAAWAVFQETCAALAHDGVYGVLTSGFLPNGVTFQVTLVRHGEPHPLAALEVRVFDDAAPASAQPGLRVETYLWTRLSEGPALALGVPTQGSRRYHAQYEHIVAEAGRALDSAFVAEHVLQKLRELQLVSTPARSACATSTQAQQEPRA